MLARLNSFYVAGRRANMHLAKNTYCTKPEEYPELKYEKIARGILNGRVCSARRSNIVMNTQGDNQQAQKIQNNDTTSSSSTDALQHQYLYYYGAHSPLSAENLLRVGSSDVTHNSSFNDSNTNDNGSSGWTE